MMRRGQHCAHLQPDYNRLEDAFYITRNPDTDEVSWPPTRILDELQRLGLARPEEVVLAAGIEPTT